MLYIFHKETLNEHRVLFKILTQFAYYQFR